MDYELYISVKNLGYLQNVKLSQLGGDTYNNKIITVQHRKESCVEVKHN